MSVEDISCNFLLPIEFCKNKKEVFENLYNDLELLKSNNSSKNSFYSKLFSPITPHGKLLLQRWSKYYTSNVGFLKDSQKLYKNYINVNSNPKLCVKAYDLWKKTSEDENFKEKYHYIEWEKCLWLNKSSSFLLILSFYSILSPVLNLIAPIIILIIPFLIIKIMKIPITVSSYVMVLKKQLDKHSFGQLFTRFSKVSFSQRIYLLMCFGMYVYNIYQNIISCYQFYTNTHFINNYFKTMKQYIKYTKNKLENYIALIKNLKTHAKHKEYLLANLNEIYILSDTLSHIPNATINPLKLKSMGFTMKQFYLMNNSKKLQNILKFSFGFNGYLDNLNGLKIKINNKNIRPATFTKKSNIKLKNCYYPMIKGKIIKNTVDISNNIIITGPNAAGKTTLLKTIIINILITQQLGLGFYDKCKISPVDYLHCYLNIPDTSARDSLFQAEARRCNNILTLINKYPNKKHFCIFDELYSGTNPYEAIASAYSYLDFISINKNVKFVLTTHFIKLCKLFKKNSKINNYNMETHLNNKDVANYLYKLIPGISKIKGGVTVLKNLGYPQKIINKTKEILCKM